MKKFYKFYSLKTDLKKERFVKVLQTKSIYMCNYLAQSNGNDNKEGRFFTDRPLDEILRKELKQCKQTYMIGCATDKLHNPILWQQPADSGSGVCISFEEIKRSEITKGKVKYLDSLHYDEKKFYTLSLEEKARFALMHKRKKYQDEREIRFLKKVNNIDKDTFMEVKIKTLYLGWNMSKKECDKWKNIAKDCGIKVIKLRKAMIV